MASCSSSSDESPPSALPLPPEIESLDALHLEGNCVTLKSRDEKEFVITRAMAMQCETLRRHIIERQDDDTRIIVPLDFESYYVERVTQYLRKHANVEAGDDLKAFDKEFVTNNTNDDLCFLLAAAYDLKAEHLFRLVRKRFYDLVVGRTPEELRGMFTRWKKK